MELNKGTHSGYDIDLFMPIMKEADGKYIAVLSDDSVDRDEEKLSKGCIEKLGYDNEYLAALVNHKNDVFMQVAEWTHIGVKEVDGHTALVAEPKFYTSNPNSKIIKGMLDEGAKLGISIGAMVKNYDEIDGMKVYTELELVEASFVAIPSNRHGRVMAIAKSFNRNKEENIMDKIFTQKDIDSALEKKADEMKADFSKRLVANDTEISKLQKNLKKAEEEKEEAVDDAKEADDAAAEDAKEAEKKHKSLEKDLQKEKDAALEKQNFANQGGDSKAVKELSAEEIDKSFESGKLPVMRME